MGKRSPAMAKAVLSKSIDRIGNLFVFLISLSLLLLLTGVVLEPALPYFQLDVVLSPKELQDDDVRHKTLEMLQKARGNLRLLWISLGVVMTSLSGFGYLLAKKLGAALALDHESS